MKIRTIPLTLALLASSAGLAQASGLPGEKSGQSY